MSNDYNKLIIQGRLTRDPEYRENDEGNSMAFFSLASNRTFKSKSEVVFIDAICFGNSAKYLREYAHKGSKVLLDGRICLENYKDSKGDPRSKMKVVVDNIQLLSWDNEQKDDVDRVAQKTEAVEKSKDDDDLPF